MELKSGLDNNHTYPPLPCNICIIRLSLARSISSFFFLSDGGFANETSIWDPPISFPLSSFIAWRNDICTLKMCPPWYWRLNVHVVKNITYPNSIIPIFKVYKSVILDLLHSFDFPVLFEAFLQFFFGAILCQIPHVKDAHLKQREVCVITLRLIDDITVRNSKNIILWR